MPLRDLSNLFSILVLGALFSSVAPSHAISAEAVDSTVSLDWFANSEANIAGYRIHYGTAPGDHSNVYDAGNTTSATIEDIEGGKIYYFALTAYDDLGLESPKSQELAVIAESQTTHLVILEAETGIISGDMATGFELDENFEPTIAFVEALPSPNPGSTTLTFSNPTASIYTGWALVRAPDSNSDSIGISLNSSPSQQYDLVSPGSTHTSDWVWKRFEVSPGVPKEMNLLSGVNSIVLSKIDPDILIDRIVLSSHQSFTPDDPSLFTDPDLLLIATQPVSQSAHAGSRIALSVSVITTGQPSYQWIKDGLPIPGATSAQLLIPESEALHSGSYCVEILGSSEPIMSDPAQIIITPASLLSIDSLQITPQGSDNMITVEASGINGLPVTLQGSSDLLLWIDLTTFAEDSVTVTDVNAANRYYRLVYRP